MTPCPSTYGTIPTTNIHTHQKAIPTMRRRRRKTIRQEQTPTTPTTAHRKSQVKQMDLRLDRMSRTAHPKLTQTQRRRTRLSRQLNRRFLPDRAFSSRIRI